MAEGGGVEPRTVKCPCRFSGPIAVHTAAPSDGLAEGERIELSHA